MSKVDLALVDWYSVLPRLGIDPSYLKSRKRKGPCPACEAETGDAGKTRFMFIDKTGKGDWYCHHCNGGHGAGGDGVELLMRVNGWDFKTAINAIKDNTSQGKRVEYRVSNKEHKTDAQVAKENCKKLKKVWREAKPIVQGDAAWLYLNNRVRGLTELPDSSQMRLHPGLDYWEVDTDKNGKDTFKKLGKFPAIVTVIRKSGKAISIHRTFITSDGLKANVPDAKKSMSAIEHMAGSHMELFPLNGEVLGVSEGIEKSLAIHTAYQHVMPIWSLVSADILKNFNPPQGIKELHIFGDTDPKGKVSAEILQKRSIDRGLKVVMHFIDSEDKDFDEVWNEYYDQKNRKAA
jgi:putative DNA primase/helicase